MDDAGLHDGLGQRGGDRLRKALQLSNTAIRTPATSRDYSSFGRFSARARNSKLRAHPGGSGGPIVNGSRKPPSPRERSGPSADPARDSANVLVGEQCCP